MSELLLLADIGGTNARFALARGRRLGAEAHYKVADYPTAADALRAFLNQAGRDVAPRRAALAVAGPVRGESVRLTNSRWYLNSADLKEAFRLEDAVLINDFAAVAWALPSLGGSDLVKIGPGRAAVDAPMAVIGPGTGLGVAGLVPAGSNQLVLVTEGGHVTMAAADERDAAVLARLRRRFDHVSAERVLSGDGLINLYEILAELNGVPPMSYSAAEISAQAVGGGCPNSTGALDLFCAMLGTVAGNLALTLGARGGVYVGGGIVPRVVDYLSRSAFRERFEAKGRFREYLAAIPTWVIMHPDPAFLGLINLLERRRGEEA